MYSLSNTCFREALDSLNPHLNSTSKVSVFQKSIMWHNKYIWITGNWPLFAISQLKKRSSIHNPLKLKQLILSSSRKAALLNFAMNKKAMTKNPLFIGEKHILHVSEVSAWNYKVKHLLTAIPTCQRTVVASICCMHQKVPVDSYTTTLSIFAHHITCRLRQWTRDSLLPMTYGDGLPTTGGGCRDCEQAVHGEWHLVPQPAAWPDVDQLLAVFPGKDIGQPLHVRGK